jgi:hypothetical protein
MSWRERIGIRNGGGKPINGSLKQNGIKNTNKMVKYLNKIEINTINVVKW